jgi:hypothetical protein
MSLALLFPIYCSTCFECEYIHLQELATYCEFISCVVLLWSDMCWCYGVVRLGWCGKLMWAEACIRLTLIWSIFIQNRCLYIWVRMY